MSTAAILALPHVVALEATAAWQVLGGHRPGASAPYLVRVCGERPGAVHTDGGFGLRVDAGLEALTGADVVVVAGTQPADPGVGPPVLESLRAAHRRGAAIVAIGTGAFVLARAGLLDGRRATTHWCHSGDLARRYPRINVDPHVLAVEDAGIYTSAGLTSAVDLCLEIVRRYRGAAIADEAARYAVVTGHRPASQPVMDPPPASTAEVRGWMLRHLDQPMSLDALAKRAFMSRRQFTRSFRAEVGVSAWQWLLAQRLAEARRRLDETTDPIESIGRHCGFATPLAFRTRFKQVVGVSPARYRTAGGPVAPVFDLFTGRRREAPAGAGGYRLSS